MQINKITSNVSDAVKTLGGKIISKKPEDLNAANALRRVNKFVEGESYNPGRGAYYMLISTFVLIPRLLQAREPDEFREIATRDVITILTILFAMKGLKTGMCSSAQKRSGLVMIKDMIGKEAGKLKRAQGYFKANDGIEALGKEEILARYSNIKNKDQLVNMMAMVDNEGGNLSKMFSIEENKGFFSKINPFNKGAKKETPLLDAAKKIFGDDFSDKTNEEMIQIVKDITPDNKKASEGLVQLVGFSPAKEGIEALEDTKGILNSDKNPLTKYARNISAWFETVSLGLVAGFLGFGLPKFNEQFTKSKHINKPGTNVERAAKPADAMKTPILSTLKKPEYQAFQKFA